MAVDGNATNVGSITAKLKIDSSEWHKELAAAEVKANQLGRANPKIKVETAGTAQAVTELGAVAVAEKKASDSSAALARMRAQGRAMTIAQAVTEREAVKPIMSFTEWTQRSAQATDTDTVAKGRNAEATDRVGSSASRATRPIHLLYSSLAMLAPAVVPLAASAVAGAGAFVGLGAAGILAVKGISDEIKNGGPLATQYSEGIGALKTQFNGLAQTSAVEMLGGFNRSIMILDSYMPSLNRQTGEYSRLLGDMGSNTLSGLLGSFQTLNPVFQAFTTYLRDLTVGLGSIGSSDGMRRFGDYALATMPLVISTVEALIAGLGNLLTALAPLGNVALTSLKVIGDILATMPTDVLTVLVGGALGAYAAFASWSALIPVIQSFGIMLNVSLGPIGLVVAGVGALAGIMLGAAASTDRATAATVGYIAALERDNGVIGANVRAHAASEISKSKAADAAKLLGINLGLVTSAALGEKDAIEQVNARLQAAASGSAVVTDANGKQVTSSAQVGSAVKTLSEELGIQTGNLRGSVEQQKLYNEALDASGGKTAAQTSELSLLAQIYGTSVTAIQGVTTSETQAATQLERTTLQLQLQNNAAGILQGTLDSLNGKAISAAQAQNSFDSSLANMGTHVDKTGKQITFTTNSITDMSAASVALRGQLNTQISSLQSVVEANGGLSNSTGAAREQMETMRQQIIDNAVAHGVDREAVTSYVDSIMKIPKTVPPTKLDVEKTAAELKLQGFQAAIDRLTGKTVVIYTEERIRTIRESGDAPTANAMNTANQYATGNAYRANGGIVNYLASGGSPMFKPSGTDTVPAMLTPGEIVVKKSSVDSIGAGTLLEANRTGRLPGGTITVNVLLDGQIIDTRVVKQLDEVSRQVGGMRR